MSLETTQALLQRIRLGDDEARNRLAERFLPMLRRWARGRLPQGARDLIETDDLVQVTLLRALARAGEFDAGRPGAFLSYLHVILLNQIRDEARRVKRRTESATLATSTDIPVSDRSALRPETVDAYERALATLPDEQQEAVVLRVEFGCSYTEIATALGRPSPDAVRMQVARALARLAEVIGDG